MLDLNVLEFLIAAVSVLFFIFAIWLQVEDYFMLGMLSMFIGAVGIRHVLSNDNNRKIRRVKIEYAGYCRSNSVDPALLNADDSLFNMRRMWFCMAHCLAPDMLLDKARTIKSEYDLFKELDSMQNLSTLKTLRLLVFFDNNRLLSLLSIIVALLSVLALVGVDDLDAIVQVFFVDIFPVVLIVYVYIFFAYFSLFAMTSSVPAVLGLWHVLLIRFMGEATDRSVRRYVYDMMSVSD